MNTELGGNVDCTFHISGGNLFADIGAPDAEERDAKSNIGIRIQELIKRQRLTQAQAANLMNVTQPEVSQIVRGRLRKFKIDRLIHCLQALGQEVQITLPWNAEEDSEAAVIEVAQPRGKLIVSA